MKLRKKDWVYIGIAILLFILLVVKSTFFDAYQTNDANMIQVVNDVKGIIKETHTGVLYQNNIIVTRVINVKLEENGFKGHYRKYLLGVFPIGDGYFSSNNQ